MLKMQPVYGPFLRLEFSRRCSVTFDKATADENREAVIARNEKKISYEYQGETGPQGKMR